MFDDYDKAPLESRPTNAVEFEDHRRQLLYKLIETNTMGRIAKVTMKVVSPPFSTTAGIVAGLTTSPAGRLVVAAAGDELQQVMFRGRIEPGDGFISPHYMWDDPCDVSLFKGDNTKLLQVIANHTLCVSKVGYDGPMPKLGDKVTVIVKASDVGPMTLQTLYFESVEDVISPAQRAELQASNSESAACGLLQDFFDISGSGGFPPILVESPDFFNNSEYPEDPPEGKEYPFEGTIAEQLANGTAFAAGPAKVWVSQTEFIEVSDFVAPIRKGLPVKSLPQKSRTLTTVKNGVVSTSTKNHHGVDVGTGASGDQMLYASLPGIVFRGSNFKTGQPSNGNNAIINIVSPIQFADGKTTTLTNRYMHLSRFAENTTDGSIIQQGAEIGVSGGAVGQVGAGGTSGPHLHWELRESDFNWDVKSVPGGGYGGTTLNCGPIYVGKSANPTNGSTTRTGAPEDETGVT